MSRVEYHLQHQLNVIEQQRDLQLFNNDSHLGRSFVCKNCEQMFRKKSKLRNHFRNSSCGKHVCENCLYVAKDKQDYDFHMRDNVRCYSILPNSSEKSYVDSVDEICEICESSNYQRDIVSCDYCESSFHINCISPRLLSIPRGYWFCNNCIHISNYNKDNNNNNNNNNYGCKNINGLSSTFFSSTLYNNLLLDEQANFSLKLLPELDNIEKCNNLLFDVKNDVFCNIMEKAFLSFGGRVEFENRRDIKGLIHVKDGNNMINKCMYGSLLPDAVKNLIIGGNICKHDSFIDIGTGLGQINLQVKFIVQLEKCIGIELGRERYNAAILLRDEFTKQIIREGYPARLMDGTEYILSSFTEQRQAILNSTVIFFNNFGDWFSSEKTDWDGTVKKKSLEEQLIDILFDAPEGQRLITLKKICCAPHGWDLMEWEGGTVSWSEKNKCVFYQYTIRHSWICRQNSCKKANSDQNHDCQYCKTRPSSKRKIDLSWLD